MESGASKFVTINVSNTKSEKDAKKIGFSIKLTISKNCNKQERIQIGENNYGY